MRILVVEDERDLNDLIKKKLTREGYSVDSAYDGAEAQSILAYTTYDAIILDIMLPYVNGYQILEGLREKHMETPVLFLTAKDSTQDKVKGLDMGANDYIVKPFSFDELLARLRVLLRVTHGNINNELRIDDLCLDMNTKRVTRNNKEIKLSAKEYALLEYLMLNKGHILSKEQIESHIWDFDYEGGSNIVDVYINYLRKKVDGEFNNKLIHTYRGRGYAIEDSK